ncbi:hypothetical protein [Amycolatopsis jejuensis]|uniref:hypothetical protein n=1 Tax=Amycolatopsis jejuensis TaxID=330084 RepID=UPI0005272E41|nr:hypothetical protein [Amycolatopsis jejuensis]
MFLAAYHFDGPSDELLPAYDKLLAGFPADAIVLHACVVRDGGITVYDSCPDRAEFAKFSTDPGFRAAIADAGLPAARIEPLGEIHAVRGTRTVTG